MIELLQMQNWIIQQQFNKKKIMFYWFFWSSEC